MTDEEIDKLEGGPEMDARVIEELMEPQPSKCPAEPWIKRGTYEYRARSPRGWWWWEAHTWVPAKHPSTDWSAAGEVLEKLYGDGPYAKGWSPSIGRQNDGQWVCALYNHGHDTIPLGVGDTAPLAICLAALAAVQNEKTEN